MAAIERITVTLTADMAEMVRAAVREGDYASSSEVVREALRDWRHKRALQQRELDELRADVRRGLEDLDAGRVRNFDPGRIVDAGRKRLRARVSSA